MAWTTPRNWVSGELVTAAIMNSAIKENLTILKAPINDSGRLEFTNASELTIASGVITVLQNYHEVDTQSDASSDDLVTITAGTNVGEGFVLHLRVVSAARTVVLKASTSSPANLDIGADVTLDESYKTYSLVYDGTNWQPWTFATVPTFASLSPLTTQGDLLVGTSGAVTGARLGRGSANDLLKVSGSDVAWTTQIVNAALPTNIDVAGTLDVTNAATLDSTLSVADDAAFDTDTLFVDVSEDRVGINTNAPLAPLHMKVSTVSSVTPNSNSFIVFEKNGEGNYLEFLVPNSTGEGGGFIFKAPSTEGSINYNHTYTVGGATGGVQLGPNMSTSGNLHVTGAISKGSSTFSIDHPLPSKTETHRLVHSIVESPETLLIYRGTATLVAGQAEVDLDEAAGMTTGTWVLLCRDEQCFTSNETGWFHVRGTVSGSTLTIECEESGCTDTVSWVVFANRKDTHIMDTAWTDEDGHPIMEPEKVEGE